MGQVKTLRFGRGALAWGVSAALLSAGAAGQTIKPSDADEARTQPSGRVVRVSLPGEGVRTVRLRTSDAPAPAEEAPPAEARKRGASEDPAEDGRLLPRSSEAIAVPTSASSRIAAENAALAEARRAYLEAVARGEIEPVSLNRQASETPDPRESYVIASGIVIHDGRPGLHRHDGRSYSYDDHSGFHGRHRVPGWDDRDDGGDYSWGRGRGRYDLYRDGPGGRILPSDYEKERREDDRRRGRHAGGVVISSDGVGIGVGIGFGSSLSPADRVHRRAQLEFHRSSYPDYSGQGSIHRRAQMNFHRSTLEPGIRRGADGLRRE